MRKHAEQMRPKFEAVLEVLNTELGGLGIGSWNWYLVRAKRRILYII